MDLIEELILSVQDINIAITTEIKSRESTNKILLKSKLIDFFKCLEADCDFTTNESESFVSHLSEHQSAAESSSSTVFCCYCLYGCLSSRDLAEHMVKLHGKRKFQCSSCLYRATSHTHVQTHIKNVHPDSFVLSCPNSFPTDVSGVLSQDKKQYSEYLAPYECILDSCEFTTMSTEQYQDHVQHQHASKFVCHICGAQLPSSIDLVGHHLVHNIGEFQCPYCIFGAAQQDQILSHESLFHADLPLLIFHRNHVPPKPANNGEASEGNGTLKSEESGEVKEVVCRGDSDVEGDNTPDNVMSMLLNPQMSIEVDETRYEVGGDTGNKSMASSLGGITSPMPSATPSNSGSLMSNYMRYIDKLASHQQPQQPQTLGLHTDTTSLLNFQNSLNELQCNLCRNTTKDFNAMKRHLASIHNVTMMFSCAYCREPGQTQDKIKIHIKKKHPRQLIKIDKMYCPKMYYFNCPYCQFSSDKKISFRNHMCSELGGYSFGCLLCKVTFHQKKQMLQHMQDVHGPSNMDSYGEDREALKSRVEAILPILSKMLFPVKSKAPLEDPDDMENGEITVFSTLHFTCPECSEKFRLPLELVHHLKQQHIYSLTRKFLDKDDDTVDAGQKALEHIDELVESQKHELIDKLSKVHNISLFTDNKPQPTGVQEIKVVRASPRSQKQPTHWGEVISVSDDEDSSTSGAEIKSEPPEEQEKPIKPARQSARKSIPTSSTSVQCGICDTLFPNVLDAKKHHDANHEDQELLLLQRCKSPTPKPKEEEKEPYSFYGKPLELVDLDNLYIRLSDEEEEKTKLEEFLKTEKKQLQPKIILQSFLHFL